MNIYREFMQDHTRARRLLERITGGNGQTRDLARLGRELDGHRPVDNAPADEHSAAAKPKARHHGSAG